MRATNSVETQNVDFDNLQVSTDIETVAESDRKRCLPHSCVSLCVSAAQLLLEYSDVDWAKREWVSANEQTATLYVEDRLVWGRRPPETGHRENKDIRWPTVVSDAVVVGHFLAISSDVYLARYVTLLFRA